MDGHSARRRALGVQALVLPGVCWACLASLAARAGAEPDPPAGGDGEALGEDFVVYQVTPRDHEYFTTRACHGPVSVLFVASGSTNKIKEAALTDFEQVSEELSDMACFGTVDCKVWKDFCDDHNIRTVPALVTYPMNSDGGVEALRGAAVNKTSIQATVEKQYSAVATEMWTVTSRSLATFASHETRPFKVLLFHGFDAPPLILTALAAQRELADVDFGLAHQSDKSLLATFGIKDVPTLLLKLPNSANTWSKFPSSMEMGFNELLTWLTKAVRSYPNRTADVGRLLCAQEDEALKKEAEIQNGSFLVAVRPTVAYSSIDSWEILQLIRQGEGVTATGPPQKVSGFSMVPTLPVGAVDLDSFGLGTRPEAAVESEEEIPASQLYQVLAFGDTACPAGLAIETPQECESAIVALGMTALPHWVSNFPGLPAFCSVRTETDAESQQRMHFNSAQVGTGRADLAPVCKRSPEDLLKDQQAARAAKAAARTSATASEKKELQVEAVQSEKRRKTTLSKQRQEKQAAQKEATKLAKQKKSADRNVQRQAQKAKMRVTSAYQELPYGTEGCPEGLEVRSVQECEKAIRTLGISSRPAWVSSYPGLPRWCSVREKPQKGSKERMHFNSAQKGQAREDLAPVCKKRPGEVPDDRRSEQPGFAIAQLTGQTREQLFSQSGYCVLLLTGDELSDSTKDWLQDVASTFAPRFEERGLQVRWMWLNLRAERKMKAIFDPPALPSAALLEINGPSALTSRLAMLQHSEEDGDPVELDADSLELLLNTVLGGDAAFVTVPVRRFATFLPKRPDKSA